MNADPRKDWPDWAWEHFPVVGDAEGWKAWTPLTTRHALAMRVLCVATTRQDMAGSWCAYCDAVPGNDHDAEQQAVLDHGDKLGEDIARRLFPGYCGIPYAD